MNQLIVCAVRIRGVWKIKINWVAMGRLDVNQ